MGYCKSRQECRSCSLGEGNFSETVLGLPTWRCGRRDLPYFEQNGFGNKRTLPSGKHYLIYRLAIYEDGFKQHKSLEDTSSVGGCYMVPIGHSLENRLSTYATRLISLTSSGISTNEVMEVINQDLVQGVTVGFDAVDAQGISVRLLIDTVGFFGDYPAVTATTDVRGHKSRAFCNFCSFRDNPTARTGTRL